MKRVALTEEDAAIIARRVARLVTQVRARCWAAGWKVMQRALDDYSESGPRHIVIEPPDLQRGLTGIRGRSPVLVFLDELEKLKTIQHCREIHLEGYGDDIAAMGVGMIFSIEPVPMLLTKIPAFDVVEPFYLDRPAPRYANARQRREALRGKKHTHNNSRQK